MRPGTLHHQREVAMPLCQELGCEHPPLGKGTSAEPLQLLETRSAVQPS